MSDYATKRIHPVTGVLKQCVAIDNYFGSHKYGYRFVGEKIVYSEDELNALAPPKPYPDN